METIKKSTHFYVILIFPSVDSKSSNWVSETEVALKVSVIQIQRLQ